MRSCRLSRTCSCGIGQAIAPTAGFPMPTEKRRHDLVGLPALQPEARAGLVAGANGLDRDDALAAEIARLDPDAGPSLRTKEVCRQAGRDVGHPTRISAAGKQKVIASICAILAATPWIEDR
jgi:hypothetical protein